MGSWVYIFDKFKPINIEGDSLLRFAKEDPLELFEAVKEAFSNDIKEIKNVKIYNTYYDPNNSELVVEYHVETKHGRISVKIIHSDSPKATLYKYYLYEKQKLKKK